MSTLIKQIEDNPWVMAMALVISNIGLSFIKDDLSEYQQEILNNCVLRKIYIFAMIYCGTKSFKISLVSTILYSIGVSLF